jgi:hypothetical protein
LRTLASILDQYADRSIDFRSIDLEGRELQVTLRARTAADLITTNPISVRDNGMVADPVVLDS